MDCNGLTCVVEGCPDIQVGEKVALSIRPERIRVSHGEKTGPNVYPATVMDSIYAGAFRRCILELSGNIRIKADVDARMASRLNRWPAGNR